MPADGANVAVASSSGDASATVSIRSLMDARARPVAAALCESRPRDDSTSRFDEPVANRVAGEFDAVAHAELLQDVRAVAIDRLLADRERIRDLPIGIALGDELDDFGLLRGEKVSRLLTVAHGLQVGSDQRGDGSRIQERLSPHGRSARLHEVAVG